MRMVLRHARHVLLPLILIGTLLIAGFSGAQQTPQTLTPGQAAGSFLDASNAARNFVYEGTAGETIAITATSQSGKALALLLTSPDNAIIAQSIDTTGAGATTLINVALPTTGTYTVTVFPAPGVSDTVEGNFVLLLTVEEGAGAAETAETAATPTPGPVTEATVAPTQPSVAEPVPATPTMTLPPAQTQPTPSVTREPVEYTTPQQILLANGINVSLNWSAAVDLNLEIRDPLGQALRFNARTTPNGGSFGFDANGVCEVVSENPEETATYAPGFLPTGSYEILVFYRQACVEPAPSPVSFTVNVSVNGVNLEAIQASLPPPTDTGDSVHIARFTVSGTDETDVQASISPGGVYPSTSLNILPDTATTLQALAQPVSLDSPVTGSITNEQFYQTYSFSGAANDLISLSLSAVEGSLDTLLQVMDPQGNLVSVNDDANNSTNSQINSFRLLSDGAYTIVATRYGKELGGTQGRFQLEVTGVSGDVTQQALNLNLPQGDIEVTLTWPTNADLQLLVRDPIGDSVYDDQVTINSGGQLVAAGNAACSVSEGLSASYIYWPPGFLRAGTYEVEVWFQNTCDDPRPVEFTLTVAVRDEIVIAERQRPLANQRFVTNFTVAPQGEVTAGQAGYVGGSETLDWQSDVPNAVPIGAAPLTGSITPNNTFDLYTFQGQAGDVVTIRMDATSQTLDTKLLLMGPNQTEVAENDDAPVAPGAPRTTNSLIDQFVLPQAGQYTIIATRYATIYGGTIGGYTISVQR